MIDETEALFAHLRSADIGPVAWPGIRFDPTGAYLGVSVFFLPATAATVTSHDRRDGIMQVSVFWPAGDGLIRPMEWAQAVVARFPRHTTLSRNGRDVRIVRPPYMAAPLQEADWLQIPVTIPWTSWVRT
jgi:hypothetical protein